MQPLSRLVSLIFLMSGCDVFSSGSTPIEPVASVDAELEVTSSVREDSGSPALARDDRSKSLGLDFEPRGTGALFPNAAQTGEMTQPALVADDGDSATELPPETLSILESMGYVDRTETTDPEKRGVTRNSPVAFEGLNLLSSRHRANAVLMDNSGNVVHTWAADSHEAPWMQVELQPNGDLYVIAKDSYLARFDWDSSLIWRVPMRAHHDLDVDPNGRLFVLARDVITYTHQGTALPILEDRITIFSPAGKKIWETRLFPLLRAYIPPQRFAAIKAALAKGKTHRELVSPEAESDLTHTNSIYYLDRNLGDIAPRGSVLLSVRELDRVVILDPLLEKILWIWGENELEGQHHATLVSTDNILIFDNGARRRQSRLLEVNPYTNEIEWTYTAPDFFTYLRGAAQKLPNSNVLATESDRGHVIEVDRFGHVVWEFWNPDVAPDPTTGEPTRAVIYRLPRYGRDHLSDLERPALPDSATAENHTWRR